MNKTVVVLIFLIFSLSLSFSSAFAQSIDRSFTSPIGVQKLQIKGGDNPVFNYVGINSGKKVLVQGTITGEGSNEIIDDNADFITELSGTSNLFIQIISRFGGGDTTLIGANSEIDSYTSTRLITTKDLSEISHIGDKYIIRESITIADIFGPNNEAGLTEEAAGQPADMIWVPNGTSYDKYFYNSINNPIFGVTEGWKQDGVGGDADASNAPIYYTKGIFIERKSPDDLEIFVAGHIDYNPVSVPVRPDFFQSINEVIVGATLGDSNLYGKDLNNDGDFDDAGEVSPITPINSQDPDNFIDPDGAGHPGFDVIWMQTQDRTSWDQYYFTELTNPIIGITPGWKKIGGDNTNYGDEPIRGSIFLDRRSDKALNLTLKPLFERMPPEVPISFLDYLPLLSFQFDLSRNLHLEVATVNDYYYILEKYDLQNHSWSPIEYFRGDGQSLQTSYNVELGQDKLYHVKEIRRTSPGVSWSFNCNFFYSVDGLLMRSHLQELDDQVTSSETIYNNCINQNGLGECQSEANDLQNARDEFRETESFFRVVCEFTI